jgi:hypothetical protein
MMEKIEPVMIKKFKTRVCLMFFDFDLALPPSWPPSVLQKEEELDTNFRQ